VNIANDFLLVPIALKSMEVFTFPPINDSLVNKAGKKVPTSSPQPQNQERRHFLGFYHVLTKSQCEISKLELGMARAIHLKTEKELDRWG